MIKFKPTNSRVLVEPIIEKESVVRGIIVPGSHQDPSTEGTIVALPDKNREQLKIGDRVVFQRHNGFDVKIGRRMFKMVEQNDILALVD